MCLEDWIQSLTAETSPFFKINRPPFAEDRRKIG